MPDAKPSSGATESPAKKPKSAEQLNLARRQRTESAEQLNLLPNSVANYDSDRPPI